MNKMYKDINKLHDLLEKNCVHFNRRCVKDKMTLYFGAEKSISFCEQEKIYVIAEKRDGFVNVLGGKYVFVKSTASAQECVDYIIDFYEQTKKNFEKAYECLKKEV